MLFPFGVVVRFRSFFGEHITLRPYGQLLKFFHAPGTEKAWNTRCRRILGSETSCMREIDTSEIIVDHQWHFSQWIFTLETLDFQWDFPTPGPRRAFRHCAQRSGPRNRILHARDADRFKGNQEGPKEGGLNIGQHEGLSMETIESRTRSNQLLLTTPIPWDPLSSF